jgi:predicted GNAT family acetyltransferase
MAKMQSPCAIEDRVSREIRFKLEGLSLSYTDGNEDTFALQVPTVDINYTDVMRALNDQGLDGRLVDEAVEHMAEFIFSRQLAAHFAKNLRRC